MFSKTSGKTSPTLILGCNDTKVKFSGDFSFFASATEVRYLFAINKQDVASAPSTINSELNEGLNIFLSKFDWFE